jgi:hypothetical protein
MADTGIKEITHTILRCPDHDPPIRKSSQIESLQSFTWPLPVAVEYLPKFEGKDGQQYYILAFEVSLEVSGASLSISASYDGEIFASNSVNVKAN